ncbi:MAG: hypothetical protein U0183_08130 [Polyangiaceae bacterium]
MKRPWLPAFPALVVCASMVHFGAACSSTEPGTSADGGPTGTTTGSPTSPPPLPGEGPPAGTPASGCPIPDDAKAEDVSSPTTVVGDGTPESCTSRAFVDAVAKGGVITFACGAAPKTIVLEETAKVVNTSPIVVIDGGGKITLSGGGKVRILYQNTCDEKQKFTTPHCQDQETPKLTVQNLTFVDGNAKGEALGGGGAIFDRGGRLKIVKSRFFRNACDAEGQDVGGGAVRAFDQSKDLPIYVVGSTFGGGPGSGTRAPTAGPSRASVYRTRSSTRASRTTRPRAAAPTRRRRAPRAAAAAARSTTTETPSRSTSAARSSRTTTRTRAAARSFSSRTIARAP